MAKYTMAARRIQRRYRRYRRTIRRPMMRKRTRTSRYTKYSKYARRVITSHKGFSNKIENVGTATAMPLANIGFSNFAWPPKANDADLRSREKNQILVTGLKICRWFNYNQSSTSTPPVEMHWALLQAKDEPLLLTNIALNFFRDNSQLSTRTADFPAPEDGWDPRLICNPINPDATFRIITHKKKVICKSDPNVNVRNREHWKIEKYYKILNTFTFEDINDNLPKQALFEVFWYTTRSPNGYVNTQPLWCLTGHTNTIYFKNPK